MLGKVSDHECGKEWSKFEADIQFAINNTVHVSEARSPVYCYLAYVNAESSMLT